jgi:hypothetical protein
MSRLQAAAQRRPLPPNRLTPQKSRARGAARRNETAPRGVRVLAVRLQREHHSRRSRRDRPHRFDADSRPSFDRLGRRMLMRDRSIPVWLRRVRPGGNRRRVDRHPALLGAARDPRSDRLRRAMLGDRAALRRRRGAVDGHRRPRARGGRVAKRLRDPYPPGDRRRWVKTKSAAWPRRELEREAFAKVRERRRAGPVR